MDNVPEVAKVADVPFDGIVTVSTPAFEIVARIELLYVAKIVGVTPPDEKDVALNQPVMVKLGALGHGTAILNEAVLFPEVLLKNAEYVLTLPCTYVNVPVAVTVRFAPDWSAVVPSNGK